MRTQFKKYLFTTYFVPRYVLFSKWVKSFPCSLNVLQNRSLPSRRWGGWQRQGWIIISVPHKYVLTTVRIFVSLKHLQELHFTSQIALHNIR